MNWIQRKIYLYNVTFGLYMLDWWERYLVNTLVLVLMWFIFYNSSRYISESYKNLEDKKNELEVQSLFLLFSFRSALISCYFLFSYIYWCLQWKMVRGIEKYQYKG